MRGRQGAGVAGRASANPIPPAALCVLFLRNRQPEDYNGRSGPLAVRASGVEF